MTNTVTLTLPIPTLAAAIATVGTVTLSWPVSTIQAQDLAPGNMQMPAPVLTITGLVGLAAYVPLHPPLPVLQAQGVTGTVGTVSLVAPIPQLFAMAPSAAAMAMPLPQVAITGQVGFVGSVSLQAQAPSLSLAAVIPFTGTIALSSRAQMAVVGVTGNVAAMDITLRELALAIRGYSGAVGSAAMSVLIMELSVTGEILITGSVLLSVPLLVLQATGGNPAGVNTLESTTVVMHTEANTLTTYDNYKFNSFATFNGVYLGANDNGIFALSGSTDDGTAINAMAQVGITDFGSSHLNRIDRCYVGYRTDGNLILRVFTDEINTRDYLLQATGRQGLHGNHVRIGKGLAARYWSYAILNQNGADFQIDAIELKPTVLRRRVGGGDA